MEKAIKLAVEGGWKTKPALQLVGARFPIDKDIITLDCAFTDPLFWQALGKALGWTNKDRVSQRCFYCSKQILGDNEIWKGYWHSFIDHLAEGKDPESFFTSLTEQE